MQTRSNEGAEMANETKHTPGPWRAVLGKPTKRDPLGTAMVAAGGRMAIDCSSSGENWKEDAANAVLIAAAPDLLAAAQMVLTDLNARIEAARGGPVPLFRGIADLHAAITRATGA